MNWFGRKSAVPARPPLGRGWPVGAIGAVSMEPVPRYEAQVREGYGANPVAQRAVRMIAESLAGITLDAVPEGHPGLLLIAPQRLRETIALHLLLHGNAYLLVACDADALPHALYPLRPERVTVETDARGWPAMYR